MSPRSSDYSVCAVCARGGCGAGYTAPRPFRPLWVCDDPECLQIARSTYAMKQHDFDRIERLATIEAGQGLERFCDEIGKTDFASFSQSEFETAIRRVIEDYRIGLKIKLRDEAPF